jgi:hypothetical protein
MARGTGRKEDAQNIFVLCKNLVFSKMYSKKTPASQSQALRTQPPKVVEHIPKGDVTSVSSNSQQ